VEPSRSDAPGVALTRGPCVSHGSHVRCHGCGAERELAAGERIGFREACDGCGLDLHACRNCRFHDPSAYNECREPNAERVGERERANRCDYFAPGEGGGAAGAAGSDRAKLDALFKKP
jgi:hypothetical protein